MREYKCLVGDLAHKMHAVIVAISILVTIFITIEAQSIETKKAIWGGVGCVHPHFKGSLLSLK